MHVFLGLHQIFCPHFLWNSYLFSSHKRVLCIERARALHTHTHAREKSPLRKSRREEGSKDLSLSLSLLSDYYKQRERERERERCCLCNARLDYDLLLLRRVKIRADDSAERTAGASCFFRADARTASRRREAIFFCQEASGRSLASEAVRSRQSNEKRQRERMRKKRRNRF